MSVRTIDQCHAAFCMNPLYTTGLLDYYYNRLI